jgi:D-glycero-D-manno-heptose 1,7-bisphosphate phosphatase
MLMRAIAEWPVQREGSFLIGSSDGDLEAARHCGLPGFVFGALSLGAGVDAALRAAAPARGMSVPGSGSGHFQ